VAAAARANDAVASECGHDRLGRGRGHGRGHGHGRHRDNDGAKCDPGRGEGGVEGEDADSLESPELPEVPEVSESKDCRADDAVGPKWARERRREDKYSECESKYGDISSPREASLEGCEGKYDDDWDRYPEGGVRHRAEGEDRDSDGNGNGDGDGGGDGGGGGGGGDSVGERGGGEDEWVLPGRPAELDGQSHAGARPIYVRAWESRAASAANAAAEAAEAAERAAAEAAKAATANSEKTADSCAGGGQIAAGALLRFPCSHLHVFHAACATPWLRKAGMCPTCRVNIHPFLPNPKPSKAASKHESRSGRDGGRGGGRGSGSGRGGTNGRRGRGAGRGAAKRSADGRGGPGGSSDEEDEVRSPDERYVDRLIPASPTRRSGSGEGRSGATHSPSFSPMRPKSRSRRGQGRR